MAIEIKRSRRKTISIEITPDGKVLVRAPYYVSKYEINQFLVQKSDWIARTLRKFRAQTESQATVPSQKLTATDLSLLKRKAKQYIPGRVAHFAGIMGVTYGSVSIRSQKTRWGSCSAKRNLSFNCLLMLAPPEVCDYVIIHELSHLRHMNHSKAFWAEVARYMPDYKAHRKWLKDNGNRLIGLL